MRWFPIVLALLATPVCAQTNVIGGGMVGDAKALGGGGGGPTWNTTDASTNSFTLTNSNLTQNDQNGSGWTTIRQTDSKSSGLLYIEFKCSVASASTNFMIGLTDITTTPSQYLGNASAGSNTIGFGNGGGSYVSGAFTSGGVSLGASASVNDVAQIAIDFSTGKGFIGYNNTWLGSSNPVTEANPNFTFTALPAAIYAAMSGNFAVGATGTWTLQATSGSFTYTPPSGYSAWN